ncbi:MAG TPA: hypothetical protein VJQ45_10830 [Ktedonobacterales bacterium]|nr:hypothetical protein [Ktedonobacterales bacterium]
MVRDEPERFTDQGETICDFGDSFLGRCPQTSGTRRTNVLAGIGRLRALLEREE